MTTPDASTLASWQAGDPNLLLASVEAAVRSYCGWHIWPVVTETVTINGSGRRIQPLPTLYLTAVTSVTETVVWGGSSTTTTLDAVDYGWSQAGYLTRYRGGYRWGPQWTDQPRGVSASIEHGYADCPPEVQAVILTAANRGTGGGFDGVDVAGPFRYTPPKSPDGTAVGVLFTPGELAVLDRYRIPAQT